MQYQVKRGDSIVAIVTPTGPQSQRIMGEDLLTLDIEVSQPIDFQIDDEIEYEGSVYTLLMALPPVDKESSRKHSYRCVFKGPPYQLDKVAYMNYDAENAMTIGDFTLMGNAETFIDLLIANANRDQSGWTKGVIDVTEYKNLPFNGVKCLPVLGTIASTFNIEWWIEGKTIHMTKRGVVQDLTFEYGQGKGLETISRIETNDIKLVTRLYAYGSERNIPADYKGFSKRLKLPGSSPYIQANTDLYGVVEETVFFEEVYPRRLGIITSMIDKFSFIDSAIDFNVNEQLLPGISAKVIFQTGQLAGYTFELAANGGFTNATKTFKIITNKDEKALELPSDLLHPAIGDQYILIDINMPASYITAAENELQAKAQEYLDKRKVPPAAYSVVCDPLDFKRRNIVIQLGNYVRFKEPALGLDANIRIIGFTRDVQNKFKYTLELAQNDVIATYLQQAVEREIQTSELKLVGKSTNLAYNNALQAKATAEGVKEITDYLGVTIDEAAGIVASGTLLVGSGAINNAGITGVTDAGNQSVRFFAGAEYVNKDLAIWRVLDDGQMFASRVKLGYGASDGELLPAGWDITPNGIISDPKYGITENFALIRGSSLNKEFSFGTELIPISGGGQYSLVGRIVNKRAETDPLFPKTNIALHVEASGADNNTALNVIGDVIMNGQKTISGAFEYRQGDQRYEFIVVNGSIVDQNYIGPV
ncbi:hypothetical protein GCM10023149_53930 [Mucilaginibacter gynuensis]|uniref:Tail spike domain-containing protein n=1 Tax=Mucilaginibacter gynuensis TaxID=1302236 RepID=A0ABP8HMV1_9SPHI